MTGVKVGKYYELDCGESAMAGGFSWFRTEGLRFWRVVPFTDHAMIFPSALCVVDDFGNLVRVPS